jgi:uncharacterized protein (TIGR00661 family)
MRIVYGVFGYGRGHATRALGLLPELLRRHEVLVLAGGDAQAALNPAYPVVEIPTLRFVYGRSGKRSNPATLGTNFGPVWDLLTEGPRFRKLRDRVRSFSPDVAICDADPWTHRVAAWLHVPRISLDHFGVLAYCRPPIAPADRIRAQGDIRIYRMLMGRPARIIVSSFYPSPALDRRVVSIGPILRDEVRSLQPSQGEHLLVYLNNGASQLTPQVAEALRATALPMRVYGTPWRGADGTLELRPPSTLGFLADLASCRAVISTAGNQLVGEAMALGKPLLVKPEDSVEQRLNADAVTRMGIGRQVGHGELTSRAIHEFLAEGDRYRTAALAQVRDGRAEALAALGRFMRQLRARRRRLPAQAFGFA